MMRVLLLLAWIVSFNTFAFAPYTNISPNKTAEALFNKAMLEYYGYLYVQAEKDFKQARLLDRRCALCYWGLALAKKQQAIELGRSFAKVGFDDIQKAKELSQSTNSFQWDIIAAAANSFSLKKDISNKELQGQYIDSLRKVYKKYAQSARWKEESLALLVDAIAYYLNMNEEEGSVLNHCSQLPATIAKQEALDLLAAALKNPSYRDHPGLIHTYIHLAENHFDDSLNLIAARKLPSFSQGSIAHFAHMPNHIYWRLGKYEEAIKANVEAIAIDEQYFKENGAGLHSYYYEYHYLHSHHFLTILGILTNNYPLAIQNAQSIKKLMNVDRMESFKNLRDIYFSLEHLVNARFNKWQNVLDLEIPKGCDELASLFIHFSRSLAYLHLHQKSAFHRLYKKIKNTHYTNKNMLDWQILVVSYLEASRMSTEQASLKQIEKFFLNNHVDKLEEKLSAMNPPIWFFPYPLFLSKVAESRKNRLVAKYYHGLYEKQYPRSTL